VVLLIACCTAAGSFTMQTAKYWIGIPRICRGSVRAPDRTAMELTLRHLASQTLTAVSTLILLITLATT